MFEFTKKAEKQPQKEDDIANIIAILAGVVLVGIVLFFALPAFILSLILTMILSKYLSQRNVKLISLLGLLGFAGAFYFWSYPPLLQFGAFWRGLMPSIVAKMEEIVQNSVPFAVDYRSYFMMIFAGLAMVYVWLQLSKALNKNWFTKEKEQERTDYLESEDYEKIIANKVKYTNQIQAKYRIGKDKKVCLGMDMWKKPVIFDTKNLYTHTVVQGTTGTGKSYMLFNIMEEALRENMGVIYVDGKGDPKTAKEIGKIADFYGKKLHVFSDSTDLHYNPVKYGKPTSIKDRLMAVMDWSEQFYEKESENLLQQIVSFIQDFIVIENEVGSPIYETYLKNDLDTIHRFLDLGEIADFLYQLQMDCGKEIDVSLESQEDELAGFLSKEEPKVQVESKKAETGKERALKRYLKIFFRKTELTADDVVEIKNNSDEQSKLIRGLRTQLELLIYSDLGEKFREVEGKTLDIKQAVQNGDIVLFSLDSNNYSSFIATIGRFIISDCAYITTELYGNTDDFKGVLGEFDEFGSYGNDNIIDILSKARSAKFGAVLGIQSISDLANKRRNIDIKQQTIDNCNMFILGRTNDPDNAEEMARLIGTYQDIDRTVVTENQGGAFIRFETKAGTGTVRKVNKFEFSPDEIKNLANYEFFYVNKNIDTNNKKKVFSRNVFEGLE